MTSNERLLSIIEKIVKDNILTKKELKKRVMPILVKNNDARKVDGLATDLLDGKTEDIKDEDVDILIENLSDLINIKLIKDNKESDEDKILSENYKISGFYNDSLIKIQELENQLQEQEKLKEKLRQTESKLKKFENMDIEKILEENQLLVQMFKITGTQIIEVPDEDIDALYIRYKAHSMKKYKQAFITENEVIPKTYYKLNEKGDK